MLPMTDCIGNTCSAGFLSIVLPCVGGGSAMQAATEIASRAEHYIISPLNGDLLQLDVHS
jgi:hypothetical protein